MTGNEDRNLAAWRDPETVALSRDGAVLSPAETAVFAAVREARRCGKILDLGVGAGRLTPVLLGISEDYLGVDYSEGMIDACRKKFPGRTFRRMDARDLSALPDAVFDLAVFSFNGLDYATHEERQAILRGIARVLKPGGEFVFSTHNRSMKDYDRFPLPWPSLRRPWGVLPGLARLAAGLARHARLSRAEVRTDDYAVINEPEFFYALMTYYATIAEQTRQLRAAGFGGKIEIFDKDGRIVQEDAASRALHYRAVK